MRTAVLALVLACLSSACANPNNYGTPPVGMETYCAPGCNVSAQAQTCNLACMNEACGYLTKMCQAKYLVTPSPEQFDSAKGGKLYMNFTEIQNLSSKVFTVENVAKFSYSYRERGMTEYEWRLMDFVLSGGFSSACTPVQVGLATHTGLWFVMQSADKNKDFVVSPDEINKRWPGMNSSVRVKITNSTGFTTPPMLDEIFSNFKEAMEGVVPTGTTTRDIEDMMRLLSTLLGPEGYTGDLSYEMLAPLCFPRDYFNQIDVDKNGFISTEESSAMTALIARGGCHGFVEIKGKSVKISSKIPATRKMCSWLINPQWFYSPSDEDMRKGSAMVQDKSGISFFRRRRSMDEGEASAKAKKVPEPVPSRRLLSVLPNAKVTAPASGRRQAATGVQVPNNMYNFTVALEGNEGNGVCAGALISPTHVVTSASCIATHMLGIVNWAKIGGVLPGDYSGEDGADFIAVSDVYMHPSYKTDHTNDIAIVRLATPSSKAPIRMYDGGDAGFTDCKHMEIKAFSVTQSLQEISMKSMPQDECAKRHMWHYGTDKMLGPDVICLTGASTCDANMHGGSPAFAVTPKGGPVLIGIKPAPMDCSTGGEMPATFTRISQMLPWIKSTMMQSMHPAEKLIMTVQALQMPDGGNLTIYSGSYESNNNLKEVLDSKCQAGSVHDDEGMGAMLVTYTPGHLPTDPTCGPECLSEFGFEMEFSPVGCQENFDLQMGNMTQEKNMCENPLWSWDGSMMEGSDGGIAGCHYMPPMKAGERGMCMSPKCNLTERWQALGPMEVAGKAFSGGLGHRMVKNVSHEFGVWTCLRDWNDQEQLMCGVRPHELGCFWFEEQSREWSFQGVNHQTRLVENRKYASGLDKEEDKVAKHILLPRRRSVDLEYLML